MRAACWLTIGILGAAVAGCLGATEEGAPTLSEAILWSGLYPNLTIHVDYVAGHEPTDTVLTEVAKMLTSLTGKDAVDMGQPRVLSSVPPEPDGEWSAEDLARLDAERFGQHMPPYLQDGGATVYLAYLNGHLGERAAIGYASGNRVYVFTEAFRSDMNVRIPGGERVERAILTHEMGHVIGLVDCGVPMLAPHSDDGCHSVNEESVMYPYGDTSVSGFILEELGVGSWIDAEFDEDDLADIAAFRAREPPVR